MSQSIRTVDFDRLASSAPVNKQAAADYSASGGVWAPEKKINNRRWLSPPETRPVPTNSLDLTGCRAGRFVVVGLLARDPVLSKNAPAKWVCRCSCGAYETRRAVVIQNPGLHRMMCSHCDYTAELVAGRVPTKTVAERIAEAKAARAPTQTGEQL